MHAPHCFWRELLTRSPSVPHGGYCQLLRTNFRPDCRTLVIFISSNPRSQQEAMALSQPLPQGQRPRRGGGCPQGGPVPLPYPVQLSSGSPCRTPSTPFSAETGPRLGDGTSSPSALGCGTCAAAPGARLPFLPVALLMQLPSSRASDQDLLALSPALSSGGQQVRETAGPLCSLTKVQLDGMGP